MLNKKAKLRNKADRLFQEVGRQFNSKCLICGREYSCLHHFFPKSSCSALRYNLSNGVPLCSGCHLKAHSKFSSEIIGEIIRVKGQEWFDDLRAIRRNTFIKESVDYYEKIISGLKTICE